MTAVDDLYAVLTSTRTVPVPTLYSTVADLDGNLGLVVGSPMVITSDWCEVAVEWGTETRLMDTRELVTEYGLCAHGGYEANRCGMDTAPGYERCEAHDGASPIVVEVIRRG